MTDNYYDEVDEEAHKLSAENRSVPSPESRDLWQSSSVGTDGRGPETDEVSPVFAQARADALAQGHFADPEPVEGESEEDRDARVADGAAEAQKEADEIRERGGHQAATGAEAGQFDSPELEEATAKENLNLPDKEEDLNEREQAQADQKEADKDGGALEEEGTVRSNRRKGSRSKASEKDS
jgi:hypothetical protein